jgi:hypothetical protein
MSKLRSFLTVLALAVGVVFAIAHKTDAAPAQSLLPALQSVDGSAQTQIDCRRYRHCHFYCRWRDDRGRCRARYRFCHTCG